MPSVGPTRECARVGMASALSRYRLYRLGKSERPQPFARTSSARVNPRRGIRRVIRGFCDGQESCLQTCPYLL